METPQRTVFGGEYLIAFSGLNGAIDFGAAQTYAAAQQRTLRVFGYNQTDAAVTFLRRQPGVRHSGLGFSAGASASTWARYVAALDRAGVARPYTITTAGLCGCSQAYRNQTIPIVNYLDRSGQRHVGEPNAVNLGAKVAHLEPGSGAMARVAKATYPAIPAVYATASIFEVALLEPPKNDVDVYLWQVYLRKPVKKDNSGDFTWKDPAAARRIHMPILDYVIRGMDVDFREQLYHAGRAMDAVGIKWSMLSAFRDDYRQAIASGFKARPGNSLHGGSRAVGGYGHGRAVDVVSADDDNGRLFRWLDANGARYGLRRPMPGRDPGHIQAGGAWHQIAGALRSGLSYATAAFSPSSATAARARRYKAYSLRVVHLHHHRVARSWRGRNLLAFRKG